MSRIRAIVCAQAGLPLCSTDEEIEARMVAISTVAAESLELPVDASFEDIGVASAARATAYDVATCDSCDFLGLPGVPVSGPCCCGGTRGVRRSGA